LGAQALFETARESPSAELLTTNAASYLTTNTYLAELETNPFIENGLGPKAASARTKSHSVVYGLLEPSPRP
jgi:hypothetical protein